MKLLYELSENELNIVKKYLDIRYDKQLYRQDKQIYYLIIEVLNNKIDIRVHNKFLYDMFFNESIENNILYELNVEEFFNQEDKLKYIKIFILNIFYKTKEN